ncbi:DUF3566 domain-containing protein [Marmoricola sp. URHB0036]|uniref:DUF3566 domain-containing protein n=1 Tax=Marmoricola sp. URHB0036 TaxID=1298863 RepID=UPI00041409B4|nr:DUF3566 domain-containing protein [Marmoricola sp. URHB0036]
MPESSNDGPIAPRRTLGGPILPPPPPEMVEEAEQAKETEAKKQALEEAQRVSREERLAARDAEKARKSEERAQEKARQQAAKQEQKAAKARPAKPAKAAPASAPAPSPSSAASARSAPRRSRRAQLRLVQVDAWSVMKTAFLLSIALGIVLVVAVAIIWGVLGAAGVWDSINSIVQQAVGNDSGTPFDIQEYAGTSRVLGFTMIVAVIDVILITAISTLGAFLYNLAAALLGGIEVTLAEDN